MFSDDDVASLYDVMNPWDPAGPGDAGFYTEMVMAAASVLDVGCGTGLMLHCARELGHTGRLAGLDPDRFSLARARRRDDIEWVEATAADAPWLAEFDFAAMTGHAFQCLITDEDVSASLAGVHRVLRDGGRFAFETRHPQARAWEAWNPSSLSDFTDSSGRALRVWHEIESIVGDVVTLTETTAEADGPVLRMDRGTLRFMDVETLNGFLAETGFEITAQYGSWDRDPIDASSREIITIARKLA
ncbi:MAG TPA: class I SAM-dependent methyltransferase [Streptosporangiaceae bacterium]|nr:class I SAM-dependent methyltransferase [Streptosporangiaceae bacterium]